MKKRIWGLWTKKKILVFENSVLKNMREQLWYSHHHNYASKKHGSSVNAGQMLETHGLVHGLVYLVNCERKLWWDLKDLRVSETRSIVIMGKFI